MFAEATVHARKISRGLDPHLRGCTTESIRGGEDAGVRQVATRATESRSTVRRTEEPNRIAPSATAQNALRTRAVLPRGRGSEHETLSAVPELQPATGTGNQLTTK